MRSLLHHTILLAAATLTLTSCISQTQAIAPLLIGKKLLGYYATHLVTESAMNNGNTPEGKTPEGAASEGNTLEGKITNVEWLPTNSDEVSYAKVKYNGQNAFMKCAPGASDKPFTNLDLASRELTGPDAEYRGYVTPPLHYTTVLPNSSRHHGYCSVYSYTNTVTLEQYLTGKNYAQKLIALNRIMPQITKGFIYLYNANVSYKHFNTNGKCWQLTAMLIGFDATLANSGNKQMLNRNTTPAKATDTRNSYKCDVLVNTLTDYITRSMLATPSTVSDKERERIKQSISSQIAKEKTTLGSATNEEIEQATDAYIPFKETTTRKHTRKQSLIIQ
ncbi:hypothetical protein BDF22DRAFT_691575 [Syncephalis plumigaleata]|nr:hypothetical protein BDF22DRAFT_691575 [Syncephalis plumigaleata]